MLCPKEFLWYEGGWKVGQEGEGWLDRYDSTAVYVSCGIIIIISYNLPCFLIVSGL